MADIPGLLASLRQVGDSIWSKASAASIVLSVQCTLLPWTDASTVKRKKKKKCNETRVLTAAYRYRCTTALFNLNHVDSPNCQVSLHLAADRNVQGRHETSNRQEPPLALLSWDFWFTANSPFLSGVQELAAANFGDLLSTSDLTRIHQIAIKMVAHWHSRGRKESHLQLLAHYNIKATSLPIFSLSEQKTYI